MNKLLMEVFQKKVKFVTNLKFKGKLLLYTTLTQLFMTIHNKGQTCFEKAERMLFQK